MNGTRMFAGVKVEIWLDAVSEFDDNKTEGTALCISWNTKLIHLIRTCRYFNPQ